MTDGWTDGPGRRHSWLREFVKHRQPAPVLPRAVIKPAERAGIELTERKFESARARDSPSG